jgi:hypothetical protein
VLPGGQSALIAQQAFHAAHHAAVHAVVQLTTTGSRNAAVLELADRYLGDIPEVVVEALGLSTAARRVLISARCQRHAIERRKIARRQITAQADADLVALRLTEALANVRYQLLPKTDSRIFVVVGYVPSADRCLVLPLKLVSAADAETNQDEWWVQTAYPFGSKPFHKAKASDLLVEMQAGALPSNFSSSGRA